MSVFNMSPRSQITSLRGSASAWSRLSIADWSGLAASSAAILFCGFLAGEYAKQVLILFMINLMLVTSYRLITTMGGWSFAHIAFAALGAYTMALLTTSLGLSFWIAIFAGVLVAAAAALLLAYPLLRTRQYNFFLATFAASAAIQQSLIQFSSLTGGTNGIAFILRPSSFLGLSFEGNIGFFVLVFILTVAVTIALLTLDRSQFGRTIRAVAMNEQLSESLGISDWGYRTLAFVTGSAIAGLAGVLLGNFNAIVNPSDFGPSFMFKIAAAVIVGGTTTFSGPILGLIFLTAIEEIFRGSAQYIPFFWGLSVILIILFSRGGIEDFIYRIIFRQPMAAGGRSGA
ncbi:branched-chain amino acid ABC transporter permease [Rhizobium sp. AN69]|uniref:branched-chain amino acid ABC transporter permease n=1 Tax=Rhizobium sp. AN69 TaxID=3035213 RepID=UPI002B262FE2|nr:branched-chain amino acid ABC transporter permease [Rhizobium sp. AN69]